MTPSPVTPNARSGVHGSVEELNSLRASFEGLADRLAQASANLRVGLPPPEDLPGLIAGVAGSFTRLKSIQLERATVAGFRRGPSDPSVPSTLDELLAIAEQIAAIRDHMTKEIDDALDRAERLGAAHPEDEGLLADFRSAIANLRSRLTADVFKEGGPGPELRAQLDLLEAVISLVADDTLDHDSWATLYSKVERAFGARFAAAAGRRRLTLHSPMAIHGPTVLSGPSAACPESNLNSVVPSSGSEDICTPELVEGETSAPSARASSGSVAPQTGEEKPSNEVSPAIKVVSSPCADGTGDAALEPSQVPPVSAAPGPIKHATPIDEESIAQGRAQPREVIQLLGGSIPIAAPPAAPSPFDNASGRPSAPDIKASAANTQPSAALAVPEAPRPVLTGASLYSTALKAEQVASEMLLREDTSPRALSILSWALLRDQRLALAYWTAWYLDRAQALNDALSTPPPWLLETIAWAFRSIGPDGPACLRFQDLFTGINYAKLHGDDPVDAKAMQMLAAAAAFRPALVCPQCGATHLLDTIASSLEGPIADAAAAILAFARFDRPLQMSRLRDARDRSEAQAQFQAEVLRWFNSAPSRTICYAPATSIWKQWQQRGGPIHDLLAPVRANRQSEAADVRERVHSLRTDEAVERMIDRCRRKAGLRQPIIAKARGQMLRLTREAVNLAERWLQIDKSLPPRQEDTVRSDELRASLRRHRKKLADQIDQFASRNASSWSAVGCRCAKTLLEAFLREVEGEGGTVLGEVPRPRLLGTELLKLDAIRVTSAWEPDEASLAGMPRALIEAAKDPTGSWNTAFAQQLRNKNHAGSQAILEELKTSQESDLLNSMERQRDVALQECRREHQTEFATAQKALDQAVLADVLGESDKARFASTLEIVKPREDLQDFGPPLERLRKLEEEIHTQVDERLKRSRAELASLACSIEDRQRIDGLLNQRDLSTANELIALLHSHQTLPLPVESDDPFLLFFPKSLNDIDRQFLDNKQTRDTAIDNIGKGRSFPGVDMSQVTEPAQRDCRKVLELWFRLRQSGDQRSGGARNVDPHDPGRLFQWLGLDARAERVSTRGDRLWFNLNVTSTVRSPVPAWGSIAAGRYRLLCAWGQPTDDQLLLWAATDSKDCPCIIFYFGRMVEQARRDLSRRAREKAMGVLLIDDALILFLCSRSGARLPAFFACTLPFTFSNPYTPYSAGNVPPEMFVGRTDELQELLDQHGSCFVYGGRQLGKSALLRAAQRNFHDPHRGSHAIYVDLKAEGLGELRTPEDIWSILYQRFREEGLLPKTTPLHAGQAVLANHVRTWIEGDRGRRVLLLLDESDAFLDSDSKAKGGFPVVTSLKKLMEETDRRFKVVFAGLHNVQRFQAIPNQPLAHFGRPICVGSLRPRSALELVEAPLLALGYRFASRDHALRVLSHTNYQPSLIQLFCHDLLRHLRDSRFDPRKAPPYQVTGDHIDEVYRSKNLRDRIAERFEWTLNLDPRYRVLAYAVAYLTLSNEEAAIGGFTHRDLTTCVREWWQKGFEAATDDELRSLIDEMVGLGLFVNTEDGRYRLRSPNVLRLLGTAEQIEEQLMLAGEMEPPAAFEAGSFRRPLQSESPGKRSPLSGGDEIDLLREGYRIRLIFGSNALGLRALPDGFRLLSDAYTTVNFLEDPVHGRRLEDLLTSEIELTKEGFKRVLVIPAARLGGGAERVASAVESMAAILLRRRQPGRTICVAVVFEPNEALNWLVAGGERVRTLEAGSAPPLLLKRWSQSFVRRWLDEVGIGPNDQEQMKSLFNATGGWPHLMDVFHRKCAEDPTRWREALKAIEDRASAEVFVTATGVRDDEVAGNLLGTLYDLGQAESAEDLGMFHEMSPEKSSAVVEFLVRMCVVMRDSQGLQFEPVAAARTKSLH